MGTAALLSKDVGSKDQQSDLAQCFEALLPVVWARWYGRLKKETGPRFVPAEQEEQATCSPASTWLCFPCSVTWGNTMILVDDKTYFLKGRYKWYGEKTIKKWPELLKFSPNNNPLKQEIQLTTTKLHLKWRPKAATKISKIVLENERCGGQSAGVTYEAKGHLLKLKKTWQP